MEFHLLGPLDVTDGSRHDLASGDGANDTALLTRANGYVLELLPQALDIERFERALADGEEANAAGRHDDAARRLGDALSLWRCPPLADFTYDSFARQEIARLEGLRLVALEERFEAELALGRHAKVVADLEALVNAEPLRDRLRGELMLALHRCGRRANALEVYRDGHRRCIEELGIEPSPQLRELQRQMLDESPELAAPRRLGSQSRAGDAGVSRRAPARAAPGRGQHDSAIATPRTRSPGGRDGGGRVVGG